MTSEFLLGKDYEDAQQALERSDFNKAFLLYKNLAEAGNSDCFGVLGWLYFSGKGTDLDLAQAAVWLKRSADAGDPQGQFYLAKLCWHHKDSKGVVHWLREATKAGYAPAFFRLGRVYEDGVFAAQNYEKAISLYQEARSRGHLIGENRYALLLIRGKVGGWRIPYGLGLYAVSVIRCFLAAYRDPNSDSIRV